MSEKYEPLVIRESCPYCGEMTGMVLEKGVWISSKCMHCGADLKKLADSLPQIVEEKPDLKSPPGVELP